MTSTRFPLSIEDEAANSEIKLFAQEVFHDNGRKSWVLTNDVENMSSESPYSLRTHLCEALAQTEKDRDAGFNLKAFSAYVQHPYLGDDETPRFLEVSSVSIAGKEHWKDGQTLNKSELEQRLGVEIPVGQSHDHRVENQKTAELSAADMPSVYRDEVKWEYPDHNTHELF